MLDDGDRREVVGQILERRDRDEERPRRQDEEHGAQQEGQLPVGRPLERDRQPPAEARGRRRRRALFHLKTLRGDFLHLDGAAPAGGAGWV